MKFQSITLCKIADEQREWAQENLDRTSFYFLAMLLDIHVIMSNLLYFIEPPFVINKIVTRLDRLNKIFGKCLAYSGYSINESTLFKIEFPFQN